MERIRLFIIFLYISVIAQAQSGTLPVLHIDTDSRKPVTSKTEYLPATYWLEPNGFKEAQGFGTAAAPLRLEIRGRGNSSWRSDKKPYKIRLASKLPLLGMPKNKHWALMKYAEAATAGLMVGDYIGMPWTAHQSPVEVVLNGKYIGLYELTETNRLGTNRVDIWEQPNFNEDPETLSGGWLVEIDNYSDPCQFLVQEPEWAMRVTYHSPDSLSAMQLNWLKTNMQELCDAVHDADKENSRWEEMLDIDAIARYFIVSEVMDNPDAFHGSFWLHRDLGDNEKWVAGPLWDVTCMQREKTDYTYLMRVSYSFTPHLIKGLITDPDFCNAVRQAWLDFYPNKAYEWLEAVTNRFDYPDALEADYSCWKYSTHLSQEERVSKLRGWLERNLAWFDEHLPGTPTGMHQVADTRTPSGQKYDLAGRRVTGHPRGVYVVNGKKVLAK